MNLNRSTSPALSRRTLLSAIVATPVLAQLLAACGDDSVESGSTALPEGILHPTGSDEVVLRIGNEGGFVPVGYSFMNVPTILISGDGKVITPGAQPMIYPGPLLPALSQRTITEAGIQKLLVAADSAGLLRTPPDYFTEMTIADAPNTVVLINAAGSTFRHDAPALGFETPEKTPARVALNSFVQSVTDLEAVVGAENLGPEATLQPAAYRIQATEVTDDDLADLDIPPTKVPWPSNTGVTLADAKQCAVVAADTAGEVLQAATQLTYFTESDRVYQVAAVAKLPGDVC
jgi:hypothetical protein